MKPSLPFLPWVLLTALAGAAPLAADDHEFAREAVQRGEILPLRAILARVARDFRGQMLEVEAPTDG